MRHALPPRGSARPNGFSMIEMLLVMFILAIGLLGIVTLQVASMRSGATGRHFGTATLLAHSVLDQIQTQGAVFAAERQASDTGTVGSGSTYFGTPAWDSDFRVAFVDPTGMAAHTSTATENLHYDANCNPVKSDSDARVFTVQWRRMAGQLAGVNNAVQEFAVVVMYLETERSTTGANFQKNKHVAVSRYVRI